MVDRVRLRAAPRRVTVVAAAGKRLHLHRLRGEHRGRHTSLLLSTLHLHTLPLLLSLLLTPLLLRRSRQPPPLLQQPWLRSGAPTLLPTRSRG